jgi:hypothetical protein|tara:strand:- start:162 stop:521 length:360 start_codon:yes stop_codon:yes gene_type:complete
MASTRNRNTSLNYNLEQKNNKIIEDKNLFINSSYGRAYEEHIPSIGYRPSFMSRDTFSNNPIDIESSLYGIGSTNLETPCQPVEPSLKTIKFKEFFDRPNSVIMPYPLVLENNQRPRLA